MSRFISKQVFKPVGVHNYHLQVHYPRSAISATPRCNTDDDSHHSDSHSTSSADGPTHSTAGFQLGGFSLFVTWERFGQLETTFAVMGGKLDHLDAGQREIKAEIKGLSSKVDKRYDKIDGKMDRLLYAILGGFATVLLKGGFDSYLTWKKE